MPTSVRPTTAATIKDVKPSLAPGTRIVIPTASAWLNGPPDPLANSSKGLIVLDVFGLWCPVVKQTAPALRELREKYAAQDVRWLSITSDREGSAQDLLRGAAIDWPVGYGAATEQINALGAFNGNGMMGYECKPTLYLLRGDGEVLWCDDHARMRHCPPAELQARLATEIDKHLAASTPTEAGSPAPKTDKPAIVQ